MPILLVYLFFFVCICPVSAYQVTYMPGIEFNAEYTDNVDLSNSKQSSDLITSVSPQLGMNLIGSKNGAMLYVSPIFREYQESSADSQIFYNGSAAVWANLTQNFAIRINELYLSSDDPSVIEEDMTVRKKREKY